MFEIILSLIAPTVFCCVLIFKPISVAKFMGAIYWRMGRFTALGHREKTKKYFYTENPFWFRTLGVVIGALVLFSAIIRIAEIYG